MVSMMAMVMALVMPVVMVAGSQACQFVRRRVPISAWLDKESADGAMPVHEKILDFLLFRLVTGSPACQFARRRVPISAWLDK